ncbi:MAG: hypothetical protein ACFFCD_08640 [Promethearchaeota archaeon]
MVQLIAIIQEGGVCAFNRSYWQIGTNVELLGGFISAISEFVRCSFGFELEEFKCQDYRTFIHRFEHNYSVIITFDERNIPYETSTVRTDFLAHQIWEQFSKKVNDNGGFNGHEYDIPLLEQLGSEIDELVGRDGITLESFGNKLLRRYV